MFEILGVFLVGAFLSYVSFALIFAMLHGGEEFSPLPLKQYWWMLPAVIVMIGLWWAYFSHINISINIT